MRKSSKNSRIEWQSAPEIKRRVEAIVSSAGLDWVKKDNIQCVRSTSANTRAVARIWGLGRIWQEVMGYPAGYIIEVVSEKFDKLSDREKDKVLMHELAHIPMNFSGAMLPHRRRGKGNFHDKLRKMMAAYDRRK